MLKNGLKGVICRGDIFFVTHCNCTEYTHLIVRVQLVRYRIMTKWKTTIFILARCVKRVWKGTKDQT